VCHEYATISNPDIAKPRMLFVGYVFSTRAEIRQPLICLVNSHEGVANTPDPGTSRVFSSSFSGVMFRPIVRVNFWTGGVRKRCARKLSLVKKVARILRGHRALLLNWFRSGGQLSSGVVEGFNTKAKLASRKSFGFRTYRGAEIALYHALGALPTPEITHGFC